MHVKFAMDGDTITTPRSRWRAIAPAVLLAAVAWHIATADALCQAAPATNPAATSRPETTQPASQPQTASSQPQPGGIPPLLRSDEILRLRDDSPSGDVWNIVSSILVILVLGAAAFVVLRKFGGRMGLPVGRGKKVTVLETTMLGQRKTVHLLQVGSRKYLVGGGPNGIRMLADVTDALSEQPPRPPVQGETDDG